LAVARARIAEVCRALAPSPLFLCVQAFDRAKASWRNALPQLEAIQQAANEAVARGQVLGLLWFAYARPGGVRAYPRLGLWHAAQIRATLPPPLPVDPQPDPEEPEMPADMPLPGQAEFEDLMIFLHEVCYRGELQRAGGLYESPDPMNSSIYDPRKPRGEVVMDQAAFRWLGEYVQAWKANLSTPGGPHEAAKAHIRHQIHNSHEARTKRGETPTTPPTGELAGPLGVSGRDIVGP
jgi:hypothetical protein